MYPNSPQDVIPTKEKKKLPLAIPCGRNGYLEIRITMCGYVSDALQLYGLDSWYRTNQTRTYEAGIHIILLSKTVICKIREEEEVGI